MFIRLIFIIAFIFAIALILQLIKNTPKSQQKALKWKIGLGSLAVMLILLSATGRIHWIGALIGALIPLLRQLSPLLIRFAPLLHQKFQQYQQSQQATPSSGNITQAETETLQMELDHDNDTLSGRVLSGPFSGHNLDSLMLHQLKTLLNYCQQQDPESSQLLISYLTHRFGDQWRQETPREKSQGMTAKEAYAILGLSADASREEITQAHRKLMQKVHPDRGGSDYLASKINLAKDRLINS